MKWEKMSQEAAQRLEVIVKPFACQKKPMFGHEVYWVNGNMFAGVFQSHSLLPAVAAGPGGVPGEIQRREAVRADGGAAHEGLCRHTGVGARG